MSIEARRSPTRSSRPSSRAASSCAAARARAPCGSSARGTRPTRWRCARSRRGPVSRTRGSTSRTRTTSTCCSRAWASGLRDTPGGDHAHRSACAVRRPASSPSTSGSRSSRSPGYIFDLVVVGSGPAGLAAAVYGASEGLDTVSLDAVADRRAGGRELAHRELRRVPERHLRRRAASTRAAIQAQRLGARLNAPCEVAGLRVEHGFHVIVLADGSEIPAAP